MTVAVLADSSLAGTQTFKQKISGKRHAINKEASAVLKYARKLKGRIAVLKNRETLEQETLDTIDTSLKKERPREKFTTIFKQFRKLKLTQLQKGDCNISTVNKEMQTIFRQMTSELGGWEKKINQLIATTKKTQEKRTQAFSQNENAVENAIKNLVENMETRVVQGPKETATSHKGKTHESLCYGGLAFSPFEM